MSDLPYVGQELDIFAHAVNWKRYWSSCVRPSLAGDVLEVGAGIGANTALLGPQLVRSWVCLEPDAKLAQRAAATLAGSSETYQCEVLVGTTQTLIGSRQFDAVLYIDVLEHIERDKDELERASLLLRKGGSLIVLSPAHQWLYTTFDQSIGHFRRYDRASLSACGPQRCTLSKIWYLDSTGMLASCGNRLLLHQAMPKLRQILFWDRYLVPPSTLLDYLLLHRVGKSILAIWIKE
jgi:protein-L-isoaspartate O-methyltransferase